MPLYKVDYYEQQIYKTFVQERRNQHIKVLTLPLLDVNQTRIEEILEGEEFDLDLTSAIKMSKYNESVNYVLDRILCLIEGQKVNFIINEKYLEELLSISPYFIEGEKLNIAFLEDKETEIEDVRDEVKKVIVDEENFSELENYLNENLIGHEGLKSTLIEELKVYKYFNKVIKDQPIFSVFLLGPSGTGKTEIGRTLHNYIDRSSSVAKVNLANYKSESSLSSFIGSPPGYIGSGDESDLVKKIKKSNVGVLIIDEFEKADGAIHNFFLQLLEEGEFDDALGNIHNLNGYVIVFTSNFTKNEFLEKIPPELRSRFNLTFTCSYLSSEQRKKYLEKIFGEYSLQADQNLSREDLQELITTVNFNEEKNLRRLRQLARKVFFSFIIKEHEKV